MRRSSISSGGLSDQIEAWLCLLAEVDAQTQNMFVEEVMELVELLPLRHALFGLPLRHASQQSSAKGLP